MLDPKITTLLGACAGMGFEELRNLSKFNKNQMTINFSEERKLLEFDLPGFKPEEIDVRVKFFPDGKDVIYIKAENSHRPPIQHKVPIYGAHVDKENIRCELKYGVLTIYGHVCDSGDVMRLSSELIIAPSEN